MYNLHVQRNYCQWVLLYPCCDKHCVRFSQSIVSSWFNYFIQLWQKLQYLHSHWWWVTINSYELICVCDKLTPGVDQLFFFFVTKSHKLYHPSCNEKLIIISIIIIRFGKALIPNTKLDHQCMGNKLAHSHEVSSCTTWYFGPRRKLYYWVIIANSQDSYLPQASSLVLWPT